MLSIIVINHNTVEITRKCLDHIFASKNIEFEVILINNTPTDGFSYPKIKIINNAAPLGFGANNNQGLKIAKGDKILLLNSDAFVYPDTLAECYAQNYDVLGCQLLNRDLSIQPSWGYFPTLRRILQLMIFVDNFPLVRRCIDSIHVRDINRYHKIREVDWVMGSFVMLKRKVFEKVGGFDENFHMYGEELEWMYRIRRAGYKVYYYPEAKCEHIQGASTGTAAKMFAGEMRGYLYWFAKYNLIWQLPLLKIILVAGTLYKALAWSMLGGILGKPTWGRDNWKTFKEIVEAV